MNGTLVVALVIGVPIVTLLVLSLRQFLRRPSMSAAFPVLGAAGLMVMVLTHVAEALRLFPAMGWGQRHSMGHYIDWGSTFAGIAFLVAAALCPLLHRRTSAPL
jgi:hypothetical protein